MSGKVASIVDIDKDWYWCIPVGLIEMGDALLLLSRWTYSYNLQLPTWNIFANARISFPSSMATTMWWTLMPFMWLWCDLDILRFGIALYRQIRLRKSSSPGLLSGFKLGVWWQMAKHGETKRDAICIHLCSLPWGEDYPWRKCDRHCGSAVEEMWAYRFWPWPLGMSVSSVVWDPKNDESPSCPHPRILLRIVMPWGGWCLMKDSDSGQQRLMIWMGWFNSRMMLMLGPGMMQIWICKALDWTQKWCVLHLRHSQMTKCQPESMNQIYPSQQSKCLGVFSKTHFWSISRAKEFSKENQNLLFLVTAPWTWKMSTLPLSFSQRHRAPLTPITPPPWGSWRSCGLALGLVPLDSWMGLYEWGAADAKWLNFFGTWIPSSLGLLRGSLPGIVQIFVGHHEYETNNSIIRVLRRESSSNNSQQSSIFCKGKYSLCMSCLTSLSMTRPLRSSSTQWTQMSHDEP